MMTDKTLKSLIDKLNNKKTDGLFHLRPLSRTVDFAKVFMEKPSPFNTIPELCKLYFIKNQDEIYVAAVLDMNNDLHWFVLNKHRSNGHLTNAMKSSILPHLFQDREKQIITIDKERIGNSNFRASEKVALSLGFIKMEDYSYFLTNESYKNIKSIEGLNSEITEYRRDELTNQVQYLADSLLMIQVELEMKLGVTNYSKELKSLVDEIQTHTWRLQDAWWKSKR